MKVGKCSATNKDGRACSALAWRDGQCRWHHPELEAQRTEGRRKGGRSRSNQARAAKRLPDGLLTIDELRGVLGTALKAVISGELEPGVGTAAASIARVYLLANEAAAVERIETRLDELERIAARGQPA